MIDNLKAICTNYGLGNTGNEYKIITEIFLYKFLNDKFFYELKKLDDFKAKTTREIEKILAEMSEEDFELVKIDLPTSVAILKPPQFVSTLFNQQAKQDFHKIFDDALAEISENNEKNFFCEVRRRNCSKTF